MNASRVEAPRCSEQTFLTYRSEYKERQRETKNTVTIQNVPNLHEEAVDFQSCFEQTGRSSCQVLLNMKT